MPRCRERLRAHQISSKSYGKRPVFLTCFTFFAAAANVRPPFKSNARTSNTYSRQRRRPHINLGQSLAASPARLRVSQGRTALRSVAHSAMRPHRGVVPGIPVCPPREHVPPRPLRRIALWSVLARGQNDPAASSVSRIRSGRLPARVGQTYRQNTHT